MNRLLAFVLITASLGCGLGAPPTPTMVLIMNPKTGQVAECRARLVYYGGMPANGLAPALPGGSYYSQRSLNDCVRQYQAAGFASVRDIQKMEELGFDKELAPVFNRILQEHADKMEEHCAVNDCTK